MMACYGEGVNKGKTAVVYAPTLDEAFAQVRSLHPNATTWSCLGECEPAPDRTVRSLLLMGLVGLMMMAVFTATVWLRLT